MCYQRRKRYQEALSDLNRIIVLFPSFDHAVMEKANTLLNMRNWEDVLATATQALYLNATNIDALLMVIVHLLAKDANPGIYIYITLITLRITLIYLNQHLKKNTHTHTSARSSNFCLHVCDYLR